VVSVTASAVISLNIIILIPIPFEAAFA
jgi:hypothetical protein